LLGCGRTRAAAEPIAGSYAVNTVNTVPYMEEYNFGIQRQIGNATVFTINYVGSQGRHLANDQEFNPADPALCATLAGCGPNLETQTYALPGGGIQYGTRLLNIMDSCICFGRNPILNTHATSNFNSLQTQVKHTSAMWGVLLSYTYGKAMDNSSSMTEETYVYNTHATYGLSKFNVPQYFVGSYNIHLPFDHWMSNDWGRRIVGGWSVSGVTKLAIGIPVSLSQSGDKSETGTNDDLPFYTPGNLFAGGANGDKNPRDGNHWFNTSLFTKEKARQFGNSHRRFFPGPGINDTDLALSRKFHIHESHAAEFRAEAFNVFTYTYFSAPTSNANSSSFGRITAATNPRVLQLAFKYHF
jgi:hypothetical protein